MGEIYMAKEKKTLQCPGSTVYVKVYNYATLIMVKTKPVSLC